MLNNNQRPKCSKCKGWDLTQASQSNAVEYLYKCNCCGTPNIVAKTEADLIAEAVRHKAFIAEFNRRMLTGDLLLLEGGEDYDANAREAARFDFNNIGKRLGVKVFATSY